MIYTIANHKGGVGKTTTAINLGAALHRRKKKVLLLDFDPQANLTQSLRVPDEENIYYALMGEEIAPHSVKKGFDVIPSHIDLAAAEAEIYSQKSKEFVLWHILNRLKAGYDYIFIDVPPSLGLLTINGLAASDGVIIPIQPQYLALQGLKGLTDVIELVRRHINLHLETTGVLITQFDARKILHRQISQAVEGHYPTFKTKIRDNVSLAEAPAAGQDILTYNSGSYGAQDYVSLCRELLKVNKL